MGQKRCDKCEEMVDEAKAFCPGCGNSFVEEERREASHFEKMDNTVQLGQTMYNQMLSDMGLNVAKAPPSEKRIEIIEPVASVAPTAKRPSGPPPPTGVSKKTKWLILGAIILAVGFMALLAAAVLIYIFWPRISLILS